MAKNHGQLIFQSADKAKAAITDAAKKDIAKLYSDWADEIGKKAEYYKTKTTASSWLQEQNMRQLQAQLTATSHQISNEVYGIAKDSIYQVSDAVVQANNKWLVGLGFPVDGVNSAFVSVPDQTVRRLITGQIYDSGWSLSKSIWSDNEKTLQDIYGIVAKGLAQNMSAYDISKLLETYVNPSRAKQWNLTMPDGVKIYKKAVDYNAQRLVRTLVQHGYQQSFIATTQNNPFVEYYIWRANGSRTCLLCADRDGKRYAKDELPMDHPNGMCTMEPYVDDSKMIDQLADWVNSPDGTYPEIDEFAKQFGYEPSVKESVKSNQPVNTHYVVQGKDISGTWQRRPDQFDFEIEDVINAQGFDGKPRVVPADEFDELVKQANGGEGFIAQRTYSAPTQEILDEYREQLYNGKWYVDCSTGGAQYGQGMYCAADYNGVLSDGIKSEMRHYKEIGQSNISKDLAWQHKMDSLTVNDFNTSISEKELDALKQINGTAQRKFKDMTDDEKNVIISLRNDSKRGDSIIKELDKIEAEVRRSYVIPSYTETLTLDPSAKVITYKDLQYKKEMQVDKIRNEIFSLGLPPEETRKALAEHPNYLKYRDMDDGSFAALLGYDAINAEGHGESGSYTVILNRTKLIIKGE